MGFAVEKKKMSKRSADLFSREKWFRNQFILERKSDRIRPAGADTRCWVSAISRRDLFFRPRSVASILSCATPFYHRNWTPCTTTL